MTWKSAVADRFIIKQKVTLINNRDEWIDIADFYKEHEAWNAYDKALKLCDSENVVLVKVTETILK